MSEAATATTTNTDTSAGGEWVVMWEVRATGRRGHGSPLPYAVVKDVADDANRRWDGVIRHWPERLPDLSDLLA